MNLLSLLGAPLAVLTIAGCAQNPYQIAAEAKVAPRFETKIVETGPQFFCGQPNWLKCVGTTTAQCTTEMQEFRESCYAEATAITGKFTSIAKGEAFFQTYLTCLSNSQIAKHDSSTVQVNQCLSTNPLDNDLSKAWVVKSFKPLADEAKRDAKAMQVAAEAKAKAEQATKTPK